ncbi:mandelate racemase/muconate lactonizing enzyme family protein [Martelella alba]|uniref:Mandelate racemase/muconate lactonizing enzyme family protein n=1 Tax=Martelella alba TaxID=2590451 RepID=A0ABY2SNQ3_9HYPH|nr:mandelate racemase/muconate lactonizing enzyme family protein [Martelella alba]TKI05356.1 mandelate racemase/muconate lactonizing enzyme family protein [Martelella alba]
MKISKLEVMRLAMPFTSDRSGDHDDKAGEDAYNAASLALTKMETLLVRLTTEDGLQGWGEGFGHLSNPVTFAALKGPVGRFFIGKTFDGTPVGLASLMDEAQRAFHAFGRSGPIQFALSAVDIALWDLCGKQADKPLWRLLGAERRDIDLYASLVSYDNDPDQVAAHALRAYRAGFRAIKLHETEYPAIAAARHSLPADARLMVDVNCPWRVEEACRQARNLRELDLAWLEEPVWPPDDVAGLAQVLACGTPIAAGENAQGLEGFRQHFIAGALSVAQPSVAKVGGISAALAIYRLARQYQVKVVPHCFYYGAALLATAHLVATLPEDVALEVPYLQWPEPLYPELDFQPRLRLSDAPGLGFDPADVLLQRYRIAFADLSMERPYAEK